MPKTYQEGERLGKYNTLFIKRLEKSGRNWKGLFECTECGKNFEALISSVASKNTHLCKECSKKHRKEKLKNKESNFKYKDGDNVGPFNIKLIEHTKKINNHWFGKFLCPFHSKNNPTYFECDISSVVQGHTTSCGCQKYIHSAENGRKRGEDLTGKHFGNLIVVKDSGKRNGGNHILWECKCSCEDQGVIYVRTNELISGKVMCCQQKNNQSQYEVIFKNILKSLNIKYIEQYVFNDCINPETKAKLRFDFYLPDYNCCVEIDGQQHFRPVDLFDGEEGFINRKKLDDIKNIYCKKNNLKLIRIPYFDFDQISEEYVKRLFEK